MSRVLLIDDDPVAVETLGRLLRLAGHHVAGELRGRDGLQTAEAFAPDVAAIDLALPDISGIDVLRIFGRRFPSVACIIVTAFGSWECTIEAMRAGACDWLNKPVSEEDLSQAFERALVRHSTRHKCLLGGAQVEPHALMRITEKMMTFIISAEDTPTLRGFGRAAGVAPGTFRNWCRTARLRSKSVLWFARILRAVYWQSWNPSLKLENLLNVVDGRTLAKCLLASGGAGGRLPISVEEFIERQRFIADAEFVQALRAALHTNENLAPENASVATDPSTGRLSESISGAHETLGHSVAADRAGNLRPGPLR